MNKNIKNEKGNGLSFHNAIKLSGITIDEIIKKKYFTMGTLYRLFRKEKFDDDEKQAAAQALGKSVEEIFGSITTHNITKETENKNGKSYQNVKDDILYSFPENENNYSSEDTDSGTDHEQSGTSNNTQNDYDMIREILEIIKQANSNMDKIATANLSLANTVERLTKEKKREPVKNL